MTHGGTAHVPDRPVSTRMLEGYLEEQLRRARPRRVLLLHSGVGDAPSLPELPGTLVVALTAENARLNGVVQCDPDELPFENGVFDLVVILEMTTDGSEAIVDEACRITRPGGELLVAGPGRYGRPGQHRLRRAAARAGRLCRSLRGRRFSIIRCQGMGLRGRPTTLSARWQRPFLGWCEWILVHAHHGTREGRVMPLRFARPGSAAARGAALDGLSRQSWS